jgi:hypothetical protein
MTTQEFKNELEAIVLLRAGLNKELADLKERNERLRAREKAACGFCEGEQLSAPELMLAVLKIKELSNIELA